MVPDGPSALAQASKPLQPWVGESRPRTWELTIASLRLEDTWQSNTKGQNRACGSSSLVSTILLPSSYQQEFNTLVPCPPRLSKPGHLFSHSSIPGIFFSLRLHTARPRSRVASVLFFASPAHQQAKPTLLFPAVFFSLDSDLDTFL